MNANYPTIIQICRRKKMHFLNIFQQNLFIRVQFVTSLSFLKTLTHLQSKAVFLY